MSVTVSIKEFADTQAYIARIEEENAALRARVVELEAAAPSEPVAEDDDDFLCDAAPTLLAGLRARTVREAVADATDADGYVRFVGGQAVSQGTLLNKLCALPAARPTPAPCEVTEAMVREARRAALADCCALAEDAPELNDDRAASDYMNGRTAHYLTAALHAGRAK